MQKTVDKLKKVLSYSEVVVMHCLLEKVIAADGTAILNVTALAREIAYARCNFTDVLKLLEAADVLEVQSLGRKGTDIRILNKELASLLMQIHN